MNRRCPEQATDDVTFDPETGARGRPAELFRGNYVDSGVSTGPYWDVSAYGQTFYMVRETGEPPRRISIITNFFQVLRGRAGREERCSFTRRGRG